MSDESRRGRRLRGVGDAARLPRVVAFVGHSGSGKTTLLLQIIPALRVRGLEVAVVKHSSHRGVEIDVPGSDTRRLWEAGADQVALVTPDRMALSCRLDVEPSLDEVLKALPVRDPEHTVILIEGYKRSSVPKIEVIRAACNPAPIEDLECRLACATDVSGLAMACPTYAIDDVPGLVDLLVHHVQGRQ